jgi:hypothetical protein
VNARGTPIEASVMLFRRHHQGALAVDRVASVVMISARR